MEEKKKTIEGNKLIAEFMGFRFEEKKTDGAPFYTLIKKGGWESKSYYELKYYSAWNLLMPVAKKILDMDAGMNVYQLYVSDALRTADINKVFEAVTDFIQFYNTQSINQNG